MSGAKRTHPAFSYASAQFSLLTALWIGKNVLLSHCAISWDFGFCMTIVEPHATSTTDNALRSAMPKTCLFMGATLAKSLGIGKEICMVKQNLMASLKLVVSILD
jgi:hypothetical protein